MARTRNICYWSVQSSIEERDTVDRAAKRAGLNRNAFVRSLIARLAAEERGEKDAGPPAGA